MNDLPYQQIWCVDFEFTSRDGERPIPLCVVAREVRTGELIRLWLTDGAPAAPPFPVGPETLFVAYYNSAELGCFLALDWEFPARQIDLCAEFRNLTCAHYLPCGRSLLGAMVYHGLDAISAAEKENMRALAQRGSPFTDAERVALMDYCQSDTDSLTHLLPVMLPKIDVPRARRTTWNGSRPRPSGPCVRLVKSSCQASVSGPSRASP
jgi:hypothetical protein